MRERSLRVHRTNLPPLTTTLPKPKAWELFTKSVPAFTIVPPEYVFVPLKIVVPLPFCSRLPGPLIAERFLAKALGGENHPRRG
jgi:hypothetical protein